MSVPQCGHVIRGARIELENNALYVNDAGDISGAKFGEIVTVPMSFETGEQTTTKIYFPYKVTVNKIRSIVMKALSGTDNGTITASNSTGAMASGVITHLASAALNDEQSASPTTNTVVAADSYVQLVSAKTTVGGKVLVTLEVTRTK